MRTTWIALSLTLAAPACFFACSATPDAGAVLSAARADADPAGRLERADERARTALAAARTPDAGYVEHMAAARALCDAADARIRSALVERFEATPAEDVGELLSAEDDLGGELRAAVGGLCAEALASARAALRERPGDGPARLYVALSETLVAWSKGASRALLDGAALRLPRLVRSVAEDEPELEGAAPLRLQGRFLCRAPWPFQDAARGLELLERAAAVRAHPLNLLFLGDAQWRTGRREEARATWLRAAEAEADEHTELAAPWVRRLAAMRVAAAAE